MIDYITSWNRVIFIIYPFVQRKAENIFPFRKKAFPLQYFLSDAAINFRYNETRHTFRVCRVCQLLNIYFRDWRYGRSLLSSVFNPRPRVVFWYSDPQTRSHECAREFAAITLAADRMRKLCANRVACVLPFRSLRCTVIYTRFIGRNLSRLRLHKLSPGSFYEILAEKSAVPKGALHLDFNRVASFIISRAAEIRPTD
jgi:hypothetical protein